MKMKKFLMLYFIFVFSLPILYLVLRLKEADAREQADVANKNQKKKTIIILTDKFEPMGRVIRQTPKGTIIYDWKSAEDAVLEMKELEERYRKCERNYKFFIQYDKWPY